MVSQAANGIKTGSLEGVTGDASTSKIERVQRVAIHPHDLLLVDGRHGAFVEELLEGLTRDAAPEVEIAFGTTSMAIATYPTKRLLWVVHFMAQLLEAKVTTGDGCRLRYTKIGD